MRPVMTGEVLEAAATVDWEGICDMGVGTAVVAGRQLAAQGNVRAMAEIVQAMLAGDRVVLEDERWLQVQAAKAQLGSDERAGLEALRTRLRSGASLVREASTTTWFG
jgi:hypothetical protein